MDPRPGLVLASESPRRRELLKLLCREFDVVSSGVPEVSKLNESPPKMVRRLAKAKAKAVQVSRPHSVIIGADTAVVCEGHILGKPDSVEDARKMLLQLSGKTHKVLTGLCVLHEQRCCLGVSRTSVRFSRLSVQEIEEHLKTGEPFDKAGAYAIQGHASRYVDRIDGCYFNVVGLPISLLYRMLQKVGYPFHG
jgi:nucleoside triphosphate pyrophosphatase